MSDENVYKQMYKKFEAGKHQIPIYLKDFFDKYMEEIETHIDEERKAGELTTRPNIFEKHFKIFLENRYKLQVFRQEDLQNPTYKLKNIFCDKKFSLINKNNLPKELNHFFKKKKKIDIIAIQQIKNRIFFIEIKITPDISKFFDTFLEFSMISPPKRYTPYYVILSDYGGNENKNGDNNRHNQLEKEFKFVRDIFSETKYFREKNVFFVLLDPKPGRFINEDLFEKINAK